MGHDVFISYSTKDRTIADAVCNALESDRIRCWYAPRDVQGGADWAASIMQAIGDARVVVYLLTENSRASEDVTREVQHAFRKGKTVIPFRLEDITATPSLEYYLEHVHWLDAFPPPLEEHTAKLGAHVRANLEANEAAEKPEPEGEERKSKGPRGSRHRSSHASIKRWRVLLLVAAFLIVAVMAARYVMHRNDRRRELTSRDAIVLADFENTTGDQVFDGTLKQALASDLDQSPFFNILSDQQVNEQLRLMGKHAEERLSADLAREVCLRTSSKAILAGSIASLGTHYVIGLNAVDCHSGEALARVQSEADTRENILKTLQSIATKVRRQLGESLASIKRFDTPLEQATTSSLEALQLFTLGSNAQNAGNEAAAVPFYRRAIALDPRFATAYEAMGIAYANLQEHDLAVQNLTAAYNRRAKTSERQRLSIEAIYFHVVTGNLKKAEEAYQLWSMTYPNADGPHADLAIIYLALGEHEKALLESQKAASLSPDLEDQLNVANALLCLERLGDAERVLKPFESDLAKVGPTGLALAYGLGFLEGDKARMDAAFHAGLGNSAAANSMLFNQALTEYYFGRSGKAREFGARSFAVSHRNGQEEVARGDQLAAALYENELGETSSARTRTETLSPGQFSDDLEVMEALVRARSGDVAQAQRLFERLRKEKPDDTMLHELWLPLIQASIELGKEQTGRAIELMQPLVLYDLSISNMFAPALYPAYLRGLAYLRLGEGEKAVAEFQKLLDHRGLVQNSPLGSLAILGKARGLALAGETEKSKGEYQRFLDLWKDADATNKVLQEAKSEYDRLH